MSSDSTNSAAFERGQALRSAVMGTSHVARSGGMTREEATPLQQYVTEFGWGTLWQRDVLPLPTRSLITVSMLIALNRPHELAGHIRGALNNGCSEEEVREAIIHSTAYCGFPAALDSMRVADAVIAEWRESARSA